MSQLKAQVQQDVKDAMRAKDSVRLGALRMLLSEIKKREIDGRTEFSDDDIQKVIGSMLKQRSDSIEAFQKANRTDLVEKEQREAELLKAYLPEPLSDSELEKHVLDAIGELGVSGPAAMGQVMKAVLAKCGSRADGKKVNAIVRAKLGSA